MPPQRGVNQCSHPRFREVSSDLFRALLSSDVERLLEVDVTELKLAVSSLLEVTHIKQSISGMDERSYA